MSQHYNNLSETHILKIVLKGNTFRSDVGIRTNPKQTYGISEESPTHFNSTYGLTAENGYIYKQESQRDNKQVFLPPFSQTKYSSVVGNTIDVVDSFKQKYNNQKQITGRFHRRKGRLGEFMDKNGWMSNVYKLMGFERTDRSRQACNVDRQANIKSARKYVPYMNPVHRKASAPKQNNQLLAKKTQIHRQRKILHDQKTQQLEIQRYMTITAKKSPQKSVYIDAENLTNCMSKTTNEKEWKNTMNNIRNKFRKNQVEKMSMTVSQNMTKSDWSTNNQSAELKNGNRKQEVGEGKDELIDWFNTTCNSNGNPWKYRKPRKMVTGSDEEQAD